MPLDELILLDENGERYRIVRESVLFGLRARPDVAAIPLSVWDRLLQASSETFGTMFRSERERMEIDVSMIVEHSGLQDSNIRNIELGHRGPRPETKRRLVSALRTASEAA